MKTHSKLLAEKYLYKAASRFFDESDQLSEKLVNATLPDGRVIELDDEDYESLEDVQPKVALGKGETAEEDTVAQGPARPAKYIGHIRAAAAANAKRADSYTQRAADGQAEYEKLMPEIEKVTADFVTDCIDSRNHYI